MSKDFNLQLPLLKLFDRLRKAGLPLGIDEYKLALNALQSGFGIKDQEALARLCRTLWVKSDEERLLFNYHFEQVMAEEAELSTLLDDAPILPKLEPEKKKRGFNLPRLSLTRKLVWGSTLLLVAGVSIWLVRPQPRKCPYFLDTPSKQAIQGEDYKKEVSFCKAKENDKLKITAVKIPPWLKLEEGENGKYRLVGKAEKYTNKSVSVLDLSGKQIGEFEYWWQTNDKDDSEFQLIFTPDGSYFATTEDKNIVRLWNSSHQQIGKDLQHQGKINDISFSPDGKRLATASGDGLVRIWDVSGKQVGQLKHQKPIYKIIFSPDSQRIVTASGDYSTDNERIFLWDISGKKIADLGENSPNLAAFSANGQWLMTILWKDSSENSLGEFSVRLWDMSGKKLGESNFSQKQFKDYFPSRYVELSPNGQQIALTTQDKVIVLDILSGKKLAELKQPNVDFINFSLDGQRIVTASESDRISRLWQPFQDPSGKQWRGLRHRGKVRSVALSSDQRWIATYADDGYLRLWDLSVNELRKIPFTGRNNSLSFSRDSKRLIITSEPYYQKVKLELSDASGIKDTRSLDIDVFEKPSFNPNEKWGQFLTIVALIALCLCLMQYAIMRYLQERNAKSRQKQANDESKADSTPAASTFEKKRSPEDVVQVVQAVRQAVGIELAEYFPVTRRQMKQSWRYLRRFVREGPATELDIEATVSEFARQGVFLKPSLMPRRVNQAELLLLIDRDGSMVPFHTLSCRLGETAVQGGRLAKADVYYFHNCADKYIYHDPSLCEAELLNDILASYSLFAGVMIFSDAGAARGGLNAERIKLTEQFLQQLKQKVRYVAWLNPMPQSRWAGTSAGKIALLVPMFEFSRQGLQGAIAHLRGQFTPYRQ